MQAVVNTFERRATPLPLSAPLALTVEFSRDTQKLTQWKSFLKKNNLPDQDLQGVIQSLADFLLPVISQQVSGCRWIPEQQWQPKK